MNNFYSRPHDIRVSQPSKTSKQRKKTFPSCLRFQHIRFQDIPMNSLPKLTSLHSQLNKEFLRRSSCVSSSNTLLLCLCPFLNVFMELVSQILLRDTKYSSQFSGDSVGIVIDIIHPLQFSANFLCNATRDRSRDITDNIPDDTTANGDCQRYQDPFPSCR